MTRSKIKLSDGSILIGNSDGDATEIPFSHKHEILADHAESYLYDPTIMKTKFNIIERDYPGLNEYHEFQGSGDEATYTRGVAYHKLDIASMKGTSSHGSSGVYSDPSIETISDVLFVSGWQLDNYESDASIIINLREDGYAIWDIFTNSGSCVSDIYFECDPANESMTFHMSMYWDPAFDIKLDSEHIKIDIVGLAGSYLSCGTTKIWLEGTYCAPRFWGVLTAAPSANMIAGDTYYNSSTSKACFYTGSAWVDLN